MAIESIPEVTPIADKSWAAIPPEIRKPLLSNAWCGTCRHEVTITNLSGKVKAGDLLANALNAMLMWRG